MITYVSILIVNTASTYLKVNLLQRYIVCHSMIRALHFTKGSSIKDIGICIWRLFSERMLVLCRKMNKTDKKFSKMELTCSRESSKQFLTENLKINTISFTIDSFLVYYIRTYTSSCTQLRSTNMLDNGFSDMIFTKQHFSCGPHTLHWITTTMRN